MDILEKELPSAEEGGNMEEQSDEKGAEDISGDEEEENVPQSTDMKEVKEEKNCLPPVQPRDKRQAGGLNVNNEVVKMRKEVKKVRALITRKLIRQIGALKKKKGKDTEMERNNRRAVRLLEEIHAMKVLPADLVTKTALQKNLNFEHVFNNPKSTISDRALTRIATHPHFRIRIELIKAAMKAFKEERIQAGKQRRALKGDNKMVDITTDLRDTMKERQDEKEEMTVQKETVKKEEGDVLVKDISATVAKPEQKRMKSAHSADTAEGQSEEVVEHENARPPSIKTVMEIVKDKKDLVPEGGKKSRLKSAPDMQKQKKDEEESDVESLDDEEKESFDDSTEERFQGQSSLSEESDHDDDFFIGKVSKFKKKRKQKDVERKGGVQDPADQVQNELHEVESRLNTKATLLQSLFCSSLSVPVPGMADGRARDGGKSKVQETPWGGSSPKKKTKQSEFQKQEEVSGFKSRNLSAHCRCAASQRRGFPSCSRCRCQRKPNVIKEKGGSDGALHPSWEASRKRKEQQGQILAFQGTKTKFDDDD